MLFREPHSFRPASGRAAQAGRLCYPSGYEKCGLGGRRADILVRSNDRTRDGPGVFGGDLLARPCCGQECPRAGQLGLEFRVYAAKGIAHRTDRVNAELQTLKLSSVREHCRLRRFPADLAEFFFFPVRVGDKRIGVTIISGSLARGHQFWRSGHRPQTQLAKKL